MPLLAKSPGSANVWSQFGEFVPRTTFVDCLELCTLTLAYASQVCLNRACHSQGAAGRLLIRQDLLGWATLKFEDYAKKVPTV